MFASIGDNVVVRASDGRKLRFSGIVEAAKSANQQFDIHQRFRHLAAAVFEGKNALVLSAGGRGAGKSYCVQGTRGYPGLLPRTVEHIFALAEK